MLLECARKALWGYLWQSARVANIRCATQHTANKSSARFMSSSADCAFCVCMFTCGCWGGVCVPCIYMWPKWFPHNQGYIVYIICRYRMSPNPLRRFRKWFDTASVTPCWVFFTFECMFILCIRFYVRIASWKLSESDFFLFASTHFDQTLLSNRIYNHGT